MNNLSNIEKVAKFFELQYQGDFDGAFGEYADPDFYWIVLSAQNDELRAAIPWVGYRHKGKEGYLELTSQLFGEFDAIKNAKKLLRLLKYLCLLAAKLLKKVKK